MTRMRPVLAACAWLLLAAFTQVQAATHTVALVSLQDDARYQNRRLERRYPGHPAGRLLEAVQLGAADAEVGLRSAGHTLKVVDASASSASDLPKVLQRLKADKVQYWVLDLPEADWPQALQAAGQSALLFNASAAADALRGSQCAAMLFHTYPSQSMLGDALAQYLAARSWRNALVLQGSQPEDARMGEAWQRAAKRYGIKVVDTKAFKLSGDPRERDLANPRLLTNDRNHDVVAVMDAVDKLLAQGALTESPIIQRVAAISVGVAGGQVVLDLNYDEDSTCETDLNVVMTETGGFVEVQGTAEGVAFTRVEMDRMLALAEQGIAGEKFRLLEHGQTMRLP